MIIDGKKIQAKKKAEIMSSIEKISDKLKLVVIQVGDNAASNIYIKNKKKLCEEVGINFEHLKYDSISTLELVSVIEKLNSDSSVTGILVQLPLPESIDKDMVINSISPFKDVDGLTTTNIGALFSGKEGLYPCTAMGIVSIFDEIGYDLEGANVVVVGRSKLVGLPTAGLLLKRHATVTVCHSKTKKLKEITNEADVLIVAVGKKHLITSDFVKEGAIVVDVGINRTDNGLFGDCDFDNLIDKCHAITPVPGGVGPLTVVYLVNNVVQAYKLQNKE